MYDPLTVDFLVDEDGINHLELQEWMRQHHSRERPYDKMRDITLEQTANGNKEFTGAELATTTNTATITLDKLKTATGGTNAVLVKITNNNQNGVKLVSVPLENLDKIGDEILASPGNEVFNVNGAKAGLPFSDVSGGSEIGRASCRERV